MKKKQKCVVKWSHSIRHPSELKIVTVKPEECIFVVWIGRRLCYPLSGGRNGVLLYV